MLGAPPCLDPQLGELVEAYAAGALDAADRARFERHLATCSACRQAVETYAPVLASLPAALAAASPVPLPASLRDRVLRAVVAEAHTAVDADIAGDEALAPPAPAPLSPAAADPTPKPLWRQRAALLAAAGVVALLGAWGVQQGVALAREQAHLRAEYTTLVGQQETVLEVVDARNTVKRNLAPPGGGGPAAPYGKLYTRPDLSQVVAMAGRLPPPPAGTTYHLWVTQGPSSAPQLAGVLAFNQGFGLLVFDAGHIGPTYATAWITAQAPGATSPTGASVLVWREG